MVILLTAVAFKSATASYLPQISYLTLIDKFVLLCMVCVLLTTLLHAIVGVLVAPSWGGLGEVQISETATLLIKVFGHASHGARPSTCTLPSALTASRVLRVLQVFCATVCVFWLLTMLWFFRAAHVARNSDSDAGQKRDITRQDTKPEKKAKSSPASPASEVRQAGSRNYKIDRSMSGRIVRVTGRRRGDSKYDPAAPSPAPATATATAPAAKPSTNWAVLPEFAKLYRRCGLEPVPDQSDVAWRVAAEQKNKDGASRGRSAPIGVGARAK